MTIQEAIDKFIRSVSIRSERTGVTYLTGVTHFLRFVEEQDKITPGDSVERLTLAHARDFTNWLAHDYRTPLGNRLKMSSLSLYLTSLHQFYDFLIIEDLMTHTENYVKLRKWIRNHIKVPAEPIEKKLPPEHVVKAVLLESEKQPEFDDNLASGTKQRRWLVWLRDRAIVHCLHSTGCRVGEIAGLIYDDLQIHDRGAWVTGKGSKTRFIRFSAEAWKYLMVYLDTRGSVSNQAPLFVRHDRGASNKIEPISTLSIERLIKRLAKDASVDKDFKLTPHSLRHFFATRLLRATSNLALTQDALGHSTPTMTRVYAKTTKEDLIKAHDKMFEE